MRDGNAIILRKLYVQEWAWIAKLSRLRSGRTTVKQNVWRHLCFHFPLKFFILLCQLELLHILVVKLCPPCRVYPRVVYVMTMLHVLPYVTYHPHQLKSHKLPQYCLRRKLLLRTTFLVRKPVYMNDQYPTMGLQLPENPAILLPTLLATVLWQYLFSFGAEDFRMGDGVDVGSFFSGGDILALPTFDSVFNGDLKDFLKLFQHVGHFLHFIFQRLKQCKDVLLGVFLLIAFRKYLWTLLLQVAHLYVIFLLLPRYLSKQYSHFIK